MSDLQERLQQAVADRYRVEREIGRGGMATVFMAQDPKHGRPVAIKVLHPHLAAALGSERFLREIQIAARLQHSHIVPLYDSGQGEGLLYYVMPYIEGESLRQRLQRETQLPLDDALQIGRAVAAALDYAHRHNVVHRDIKPENVMLHEGAAMVTDFGIAKAVTAAASDNLTQTGTAVGTPAYMSPEQAGGEAELDGRSDIYSLGCVVYEMLAGRTPFTGPTAQSIIAQCFAEAVPPLRPLRDTVPDGVERAVLRALAKVPGDRFATAAQFAQSLGSVGASTPPGAMPAAQGSGTKSIAVLPFVDMSPQRDQEYFCEGIAEELINALTKIGELRIASRTSAFAFRGKDVSIRRIGEELGVAAVLEGSVRKAGNKLRVTAQLVNVADGYHLWSERYDRDLEDVFAIQDEIAENIVKALRVMLTDREKRALERPATENVQAYEFYLRGRQYYHQWRKKSIEYARRMFERAIALDPQFARAYAGIADCCSFLAKYWDSSKVILEGAETYSRKALELAPDLAEAHVSRGLALSYSKRYEEAEREFEFALRLDPKLFEAHYLYGRARFEQGKNAEAAQLFEEASRLRPDDYQAPVFRWQALVALGKKADAEACHRQALQVLERHVELNPEDSRALNLGGVVLARGGRGEQAREWVKRALAIDPEDSWMLYNTACFYAVQGERDEAIKCLEQALELGFGHREWIEHDSDLDSLRDHPRFQALLGQL
ncbi:MAG TPA: protein kinase [Gemmatimonadales bacterium]|nr:protein kinase [Gemmatimonadales bacterium]